MSNYTDITEDYSGFDDLPIERQGSSPLARQNNFSFCRILGICCSLVVFQVAYSIELSIITPMMTSYHISHIIICCAWMIVSILSLLMHPILIHFSNSITAGFGRRRPLILAGGILILLCFISLFFISGCSIKIIEKPKLVRYLVIWAFLSIFIILHISIKMVQVASQLLFNEIIPQADQKFAKSIGSIVSSFSLAFSFLIGGLDFSQYLKIKNSDSSFRILSSDQLFLIICFAIVLISLIFAIASSKEEIVSDSILKVSMNPFKEMHQVLSSRPKPIIWISIIYLFSWMAYFPFTVFITNYFGYTIDSQDTSSSSTIGNNISKSTCDYISDNEKSFAMLILALSQIVEHLTSYVIPKIILKINMKRTYAISMSILTTMLVISGFVKNKFALLFLYTLIGICPSVFKTIPHLLILIIVPTEQLNIHRNILNSAASIGKILSMLLLGICFGFVEPNDRCIIAGGALFALVSAILCYWMILPFKPDEFEQNFLQSLQNQNQKIYY